MAQERRKEERGMARGNANKPSYTRTFLKPYISPRTNKERKKKKFENGVLEWHKSAFVSWCYEMINLCNFEIEFTT